MKSLSMRTVSLMVAAGLLTAAAPCQASDDAALFEAVREADLRIATIGWRLATTNAPLCDRLESGTGLQLHTLDQFAPARRDGAVRHFGFVTPVAVEAVVPDSPAAKAGAMPDDSLLRAGPVDMAALPGKPNTTDRLAAAQSAIAGLPRGTAIEITANRNGGPAKYRVMPVAACATRFELELNNGFTASADGKLVQIGSGFLDSYSDDQLAAAIAHEFAHNILHHRDRLEARGVDYGLLSGFGANVKYFRQTEIQADLLSVYLLANAGYPPRAAVEFWKKFGPSKAGGILRSRSHPAWRDRVATLEAEITKIEQSPGRPIIPTLIADRDKPLDGDWQSILVRSR